MPSGFLIDRAGLKGTRVGDIEISDKHAAFFINHGDGTAQDMKKLVKLVKEKVKAEFGVELEEEIFYLS
jgi:UDP-N-acetylmuramate dehydrogenase